MDRLAPSLSAGLLAAGLLTAGSLTGCTAIKSTVHLAKAEQALQLAAEAEAPVNAPYAWTAAEELILKAREEWASSDFGPAEALSIKALDAANQAAEQARTAPSPIDIPEWADLPENDVQDDVPSAPDSAAAQPSEPAQTTPFQPKEPAPDAGGAWDDGNVTEGDQPWGDK